MAHARLTQARMFDWIRACLDTDAPTPSDAAIVDQFNLPSVESARSLLADLADAGQISIKGIGDERVITLGRRATAAETPRPVPSVVKPEGDVDRVSAQIKAILARGKAAVAPTPEPIPNSPAASPLAVDEGAQRGSSPADAAPQAPKLEMARLPTQKTRPEQATRDRSRPKTDKVAASIERIGRHNMTVALPEAAYWTLVSRAKAAGKMPGVAAREMVLAALDTAPDAEPVESNVKPLVPAAITAAAIRDGVPVVQFMAMLLARGLASYEADAARERAA